MSAVKCLKCHKRTASVRMVRIVDGKAHTVHLCEQCAAQISPYQKQVISLQEAIDKLLAQLVEQDGQSASGEPDEEHEPAATCPGCGLTLAAYRKTFMLGCSQCYTAFDTTVERQVRRLHGCTGHVGRAPHTHLRHTSGEVGTLETLRRQLDVAVAHEDFEQAVRLRDHIRQLQGDADHAIPDPEM